MIISEKSRRLIGKLLDVVHYDDHWARSVMYEECFRPFWDFGPSQLDVLEISALRSWMCLARRGWFKPLINEPEFPVSVWALAKK